MGVVEGEGRGVGREVETRVKEEEGAERWGLE